MELQEELKQRAIECGLCELWQNNWGAPDRKRLIEMFVTGANFCCLHDFPGAEYIRKHFSRDELLSNRIYLDEPISLDNPKNIIVLGRSSGNIRLSGFSLTDIHVCHNSILEIQAKEFSRCSVSVYGNAMLNIDNGGYNPVYVYRHGGTVTTTGNVVVRDKRR